MTKAPAEQYEIAQELHDNIAQSLAATSLMLQTLLTQSTFPVDSTRQMLHRAHTTIRTANAELRTLIDRIRGPANPIVSNPSPRTISRALPVVPTRNQAPATASLSTASQKLVAIDRIRRIGLIESLREYFAHALLHQVQFQFQADQYQRQELAIEVELFRVAQEAVSNAIRHGQAKRVDVTLQSDPQYVQLRVFNDGLPLAGATRTPGLGIASMQMRMQRLAGQLRVENSDGGVLVQANVPAKPLILAAVTDRV
jgi:signal transduction histidine kinase